MAAQPTEQEMAVTELELRVDRLRSLYDQYFCGIEKLEPMVPKKDVERRVIVLRKMNIRNTALRFKFLTIVQRLNTYTAYWQRISRQIEEGTYKRDVRRAAARFGPEADAAAAGRERDREKKKDASAIELNIDDFEEEVDMKDLHLSLDDDFGDAFAEEPIPKRAPGQKSESYFPAPLPNASGAKPVSFSFGPGALDNPFASARPPAMPAMPVMPPMQSGIGASGSSGSMMAPPGAPPTAGQNPNARFTPTKPPDLPPRAFGGANTGEVGTGLRAKVPAIQPLHRPNLSPITPAGASPVKPANGQMAQPAPAAPAAAPAPAARPAVAAASTAQRAVPPPAARLVPPPTAAAAATPAARPVPAPAPARAASGGGEDDQRARQIYSQLVEAKRSRQESTASLTFDGVAKSIRESTARLKEKHGDKKIDFEVTVKDGKTILRPVVK